MTKYDPFRDYLENLGSDVSEITLTFRQIESILRATLPNSAHRHRAWWSNPISPTYRPQARAWLAAGWKVDAVDQEREWVRFRRASGDAVPGTRRRNMPPHSIYGFHPKTLQRMERRVNELITDFGDYVERFDQANLFTGPSLWFHLKTLERRRAYNSATAALKDDAFLESIYATLTAWGMHRMGPIGAKMVELPDLIESFRRQADRIQQVEGFQIWEIGIQDVPRVTDRLWGIISQLEVGVGKAKIVAGSKALHHLLPELVPPIDRQYTIRFFFHHTTLNRGDEAAFQEMYPHFHGVAVACRDGIQSQLGVGMNTSATKVIDNAIVGYVLERLRKSTISDETIK